MSDTQKPVSNLDNLIKDYVSVGANCRKVECEFCQNDRNAVARKIVEFVADARNQPYTLEFDQIDVELGTIIGRFAVSYGGNPGVVAGQYPDRALISDYQMHSAIKASINNADAPELSITSRRNALVNAGSLIVAMIERINADIAAQEIANAEIEKAKKAEQEKAEQEKARLGYEARAKFDAVRKFVDLGAADGYGAYNTWPEVIKKIGEIIA